MEVGEAAWVDFALRMLEKTPHHCHLVLMITMEAVTGAEEEEVTT